MPPPTVTVAASSVKIPLNVYTHLASLLPSLPVIAPASLEVWITTIADGASLHLSERRTRLPPQSRRVPQSPVDPSFKVEANDIDLAQALPDPSALVATLTFEFSGALRETIVGPAAPAGFKLQPKSRQADSQHHAARQVYEWMGFQARLNGRQLESPAATGAGNVQGGGSASSLADIEKLQMERLNLKDKRTGWCCCGIFCCCCDCCEGVCY